MLQVVTIDGPAGSGKSTVAHLVAADLGWRLLDTGGMYRAVTLFLLREGVDPGKEEALRAALDRLDLALDGQGRVRLDGRPVPSERLRSPAVERAISRVADSSPVRHRMRALQREVGRKGELVAEGRDLGSVVFPDAAFKFYLEADLECRARRRLEDFRAQGRQAGLDRVLGEMARRDRADLTRTDGTLICPEDAHRIDTTRVGPEEVAAAILSRVRAGGEAP
jgi:cytidylate kinase